MAFAIHQHESVTDNIFYWFLYHVSYTWVWFLYFQSLYLYSNVCMLSHLSCIWLFAMLWTDQPDFYVLGIFQARILDSETSCSVVSDSATPWTVAYQAPLSMGFSRQEYWSGLPLPSPGDNPDPGIKLTSFTSPTLAGRFFTTSATCKDFLHSNIRR